MNTRPPRPRSNWAQLIPGQPVLLAGVRPDSVGAEDYRKIAIQVEEAMLRGSSEHQFLAITSPAPRVGKTLTALNLALLLARRGERRVLLLEGDMWRPSLTRYVNIDSKVKGLSEILWSGYSTSDAIASVWGVGLDILASGSAGEMSDFVTGDRLTQLSAQLRETYDLVVVDCPPLLVSGGRSLATWADRSILVARAGVTKRSSIEEALEILGPERTLGMILNDVRSKASRYEYYRYSEGSDRRTRNDGRDHIVGL